MTTVNDLRNNPDSIAITHGTQFHYLAHWAHARDGEFSFLWHAANSARTEGARFFTRRDAVLADQRLSDSAKREDEKKIALDILHSLGQLQRNLNDAIAGHDAERQHLAQVQPSKDPAQMLLDIELARSFRDLSPGDRKAMMGMLVDGREPRMVDAIMRLPALLFGISPEALDVIRSNAIARSHPEDVGRLQELHAAAQTTQRVISRVVALVTDASSLTLQERMISLGDGAWQRHVDGNADALRVIADRYMPAA